MSNNTTSEYMEIDLLHIIKLLFQKIWIIIICMVLLGAMAFSYALFFITPQYEATAMMYVNNSSFTVGSTSFSISAGELSAAKSLLEIYVVILKTRTTLEKVIDKAGLDYTYEELYKMVSASAMNDTEVFKITVSSSDPTEAKLIVDTIVEVLPDRISDIVDGSSVRLVDHAVRPNKKASPSYTKYALIGMVLGAVLSCGAIIVLDLLDTTVRDEDYLKNYDIPVLAVIPNVNDHKSSYQNYYRSYSESRVEESGKV